MNEGTAVYLHLGKDVVVRDSSVVGIFDLDITSQSHITRRFLELAQTGGRVKDVSPDELPASFIVCADDENDEVYISQISTSTLAKRSRRAGDGRGRPR